MNKSGSIVAIVCYTALLIMFNYITLCKAQEMKAANLTSDYVETLDNGTINWGGGIITAVGIGAPPANAANMAQARAMARRAAITVARRNLLEIIKGVRVDSETFVKDFIVQSDVIMTRVSGVIRNSRIIDTKYMSDGSVEVTVAMPLHGSWNETLLSMIQTKETKIKSISPLPPEEKTIPPNAENIYTGLVIDARGLGVKPTMSPKVLDETGKEVYGSAYVSREFAIQQGMVGYARDLTLAQQNPRVADNPLTVKAIKASGQAKTDIVLSTPDANLIKNAAKNLNFLEKCKVMVVLD